MCSSEARNYFPKPGLKKCQIVLFLWVFSRISKNICIKRVQIFSEIGFYDVSKFETDFHCGPEKYSLMIKMCASCLSSKLILLLVYNYVFI